MSDSPQAQPGSIGWIDLTVRDAEEVRNFYEAVAGWRHDPVDMGDYSDYAMRPAAGGGPVSGICHQQGGKVLMEPKDMGNGSRYSVIQDPAGAVCALYQPA